MYFTGAFIFNLSTYTQQSDKSKNSEIFHYFRCVRVWRMLHSIIYLRYSHGPTTSVNIEKKSYITTAVKGTNWIKKIAEVLNGVYLFNYYLLIKIVQKP